MCTSVREGLSERETASSHAVCVVPARAKVMVGGSACVCPAVKCVCVTDMWWLHSLGMIMVLHWPIYKLPTVCWLSPTRAKDSGKMFICACESVCVHVCFYKQCQEGDVIMRGDVWVLVTRS